MVRFIYRARGIYEPTGRNAWLTNVWRRTYQEAQSDITAFAYDRYTNVRVVTMEYDDYLKKYQNVPRF